jgi:uncharacterized membrane protein YeaQ/YmgE (transglycosylase-associated protein family)
MPHEMVRFLLVGFVSGWIVSILARGRIRARGCFTYTVIGMLGALGGGYLFELLHISEVASVLAAAIGAAVVLSFVRLVRSM